MEFNSTDVAGVGVSIVNAGGSPTDVTFAQAGTYQLVFSGQVVKTSSGTDQIDIWLTKDGALLPYSNSRMQIPATPSVLVVTWTIFVTVTDGQHININWSSLDGTMSLAATASQVTPTRPATPSARLTVTRIS
jgi:hypothetical protein